MSIINRVTASEAQACRCGGLLLVLSAPDGGRGFRVQGLRIEGSGVYGFRGLGFRIYKVEGSRV